MVVPPFGYSLYEYEMTLTLTSLISGSKCRIIFKTRGRNRSNVLTGVSRTHYGLNKGLIV